MKKNRMMRLASGLLVAVLVTTSMISGTFAKYTTQDSASDSARVAKWGVELQAAGDLYSENYASGKATTANVAQVGPTDATVSVFATGTNLVAPGTKNDNGLKFSLNGQPEVSGKISAVIEYENIYLTEGTYGVMVEYGKVSKETYESLMNNKNSADELVVEDDLYVCASNAYTKATEWNAGATYYTLEDYVKLSDNYYPVEYQLVKGLEDSTEYNKEYVEGVNDDTLAGLVEEVEKVLFTAGETTKEVVDGKTTLTYTDVATFTPNTKLHETFKLSDENIIWKWDFCQESPECGNGNDACEYCKADTILGNLQVVTASTELNGTVVKLDEDGSTYVAPVAATGEDAKDYNLETSFFIDITVTQVD